MARHVHEIMNRELFAVRPEERASLTKETILALGISTVPVIDDARRPLGALSLRDVVDVGKTTCARDRMQPVVTIGPSATVEQAATALASANRHHLVVVEDDRAVGIVSSLDLLRAMLGLPAMHPDTFPHYDTANGVSWTDDLELTPENALLAPSAPGLLVIVHGGVRMIETAVWVETARDVSARLREITTAPSSQHARLARLLERSNLRFRATAVADDRARAGVFEKISASMRAREESQPESGA